MVTASHNFSSPLKEKQTFTLLELLVVISIIAILASLLIPVLSKAREASRFTVCKSNQKQIGTAYILYTTDNNGFYPGMFEVNGPIGWDDALAPYLGLDYTIATGPTSESAVLACPSDDVPRGNNSFKRSYNASLYSSKFSHIFNGLMGYPSDGTYESVKFTDVTSPASVVVSGETWANMNRQGAGYDNHSKLILPYYKLLSDNTNDIIRGFFLGHDGKGLANFSFVDGHVEGMNGKKLFQGQESPGTFLSAGTMFDHQR